MLFTRNGLIKPDLNQRSGILICVKKAKKGSWRAV
jgi:hypothetical protein